MKTTLLLIVLWVVGIGFVFPAMISAESDTAVIARVAAGLVLFWVTAAYCVRLNKDRELKRRSAEPDRRNRVVQSRDK